MEAFVALLRGINVGRGNRVPMADLRALLERHGYTHVSTLLNSGNAIFCASAKAGASASRNISESLAAELGVSVPVIVKSARQLSAVVADNPNSTVAEPSRLLVAFAPDAKVLAALAVLEQLLTAREHLHVTPEAAYLYCAEGVSESKAAAALLGTVEESPRATGPPS